MKKLFLSLISLALAGSAYAQLNTFSEGDVISAEQMNENFEYLEQQFRGARATIVDCGTSGTGSGINEAIAQGFNDITVSGTCNENLVFSIWNNDASSSSATDSRLTNRFLKITGTTSDTKIVDTSQNTEAVIYVEGATTVFLKNLTLEGGNSGIRGVRNSTILLEDVAVRDFTARGIGVVDSSFLGSKGSLTIEGNSAAYGIILYSSSGWQEQASISGVRTGVASYAGSHFFIAPSFEIQAENIGIDITNGSVVEKWGDSNGAISNTKEAGIRVKKGTLHYVGGNLEIKNLQSGPALQLEDAKAEIHNLNIPNFDAGTDTAAIYAVTSELRLNDSTASTTTGGASHIISSGMAKMWLNNINFSGKFEVAVLGLYAGSHAIVEGSQLTSNSYLGIDLTGMSSIWIFGTDVTAQGEGVTAEENSFFQIRDGSTIKVSDGTGIIAETGSGVYVRSGSNITSTGGPAIDMQQNTWLNIESVEQGETTIIDRTDTSQSDIELAGNSSINVGEGNQIGEVSCTSLTSLAGNLSGVGQWKGGCETSTSSTGTLDDLQGTWITSCYKDENDLDGPTHIKESFKVSGTNITSKTTYFTDASCADPMLDADGTFSNLHIGDKIALAGEITGYQITYTLQTYTNTLLSSKITDSFNTDNYCGITWTMNTAVDILGKTCDGNSNPVKNTSIFSLYSISGNNLFLGTTETTTYPITVNTSIMYVKQ